MENDACHGAQSSALSYLLREVSKLASPDHDSFLDAAPPPTWINEHSRPFMLKKRQEDAHSFRIPNSCSKNCLPHIASCNPFKKVKEEIQAGKVTAVFEPHREFSSPWKVLSLINLQCEKLLHHRGVEESDPSSVSSAAGFSHLMNKSLNAAPSVCNCTREEVPAPLSPGKEVRFCSGGAGGSETDRCVRNSRVGCCVRSHSTEKLNTASSPQLISPLKVQLTFNPAPKLDHNANLSVNTEAICDTQLHPMSSVPPSSPSASLLFSITGKSCSPPNQNHTVATPEPERSPIEGRSPPAPQLKCSSHNGEANPVPSATSEPEHPPVQKEETAPPSTQQQGTRTRRKQPHPCRSFDILDPDFQGVMFRMDAELGRSREQCRLHIASRFSKKLRKGVRKPRMRTRTSQKSFRIRSSDEESDLTTGVCTEGKICASCCTRKTPMWRDAEDGTPLCNACGIRYKKYRVRCVNCWHIPRKDGNSNSCCHKCGNFVKLTSTQRKPTS